MSAVSYPVDEATPLATTSRTATRPVAFWAIVLLILVGHSEAVALSYNLVSPALTGIATSFATTQVGWVFTALSLTGAVLTPLICKLADIYGKKKAIVAITVIATVGCAVVATANSFTWVLVGRAMEGFFLALIPLTYSLMRDTFPSKMLAFAVTIAASGVGVVTISGPFLAGYLVDNHGWRSVFWFLFALQLGRRRAGRHHRPRVAHPQPRQDRLVRRHADRRRHRPPAARPEHGRDLAVGRHPHARLPHRRHRAHRRLDRR